MNFLKSFLLAFTFFLASVNIAFSQNTDTSQAVEETTTLSIAVKGITCSTDLTMISTNVTKLNGVKSCDVIKQGPTSKFKVTFNPVLVTKKDIHTAIEGTGSCEDPDERPYKVKKKS